MVTTLQVRLNNPYRTGRVETFTGGEQLLLREPLVIENTLQDRYHTVKSGQTLDYIAWLYYHADIIDASKLWWLIADANQIHDPFDMEALLGRELIVPEIDKLSLRF